MENMIDSNGMVLCLGFPSAGKYSIGIDLGTGSDEGRAAVIRLGENGAPDELVQTLRLDKESRKWIPE